MFVFGWASYMQIELTPSEPKTQKIRDLLIGNQARLPQPAKTCSALKLWLA